MKSKKLQVEDFDVSNLGDYIGKGHFGECYHYKDKLVLKCLTNYDDKMIEHLKVLIGIENSTYVFPISFVKDNDHLFGILIPFLKGFKLDREISKIKVKDLLSHLISTYEDTLELSSRNILTEDVEPKNMVLKDDRISIYDTDFYLYLPNRNGIEEENLFNLNRTI